MRIALLGVLVVGVVSVAIAHEGDAGPEDATPGLSAAQRDRADRLFGIVVCNCPKEDWTRTLAGCANSCANHQKNEIRRQVLDGWTDDRILEDQVKKYGPKAVGRTSAAGFSGFLIYGGPLVALALFTVALVLLLRRLTRKAPVVASGAVSEAPGIPASSSSEDRQIGDEIDRELAAMD